MRHPKHILTLSVAAIILTSCQSQKAPEPKLATNGKAVVCVVGSPVKVKKKWTMLRWLGVNAAYGAAKSLWNIGR